MNAIFCVDKNWGIGKDGHLLFHLKKDMEFFKSMTMDKVVIMGRKTLESLPGGKPLKGRANIVLSSKGDRKESESMGYTLCHDKDELFEEIRKYDSRDIYVIGGASVYKELLPYCKKAYVTKVDADGKADVFVSNLDKEEYWMYDGGERYEENGIGFEIGLYYNLKTRIRPREHFLEIDYFDYGEVKTQMVNLSHIVRVYKDNEGDTRVDLDIPDEEEGTLYTSLYAVEDYNSLIKMIRLQYEWEGNFDMP